MEVSVSIKDMGESRLNGKVAKQTFEVHLFKPKQDKIVSNN